MKSKIFLTLCLPLFLAVGCGGPSEDHMRYIHSKLFSPVHSHRNDLKDLKICKEIEDDLEYYRDKFEGRFGYVYRKCDNLLTVYKDSENTGADEDEGLQKVCSDQENLKSLKNRGELFPSYKRLYDRCIKFLEEHKTSETAAK